jgi:hypothetical protein
MHGSGASRRGIAKACDESVIARSEATKQSILSLRGEVDCFASLAMTALHLYGCLKIESGIFGNRFDGCYFAAPPRTARLVKQWALAHRGELEDNWRRARSGTPLVKIAGLDDD